MTKPPQTPPDQEPHKPAEKSEELKREEANPAEALKEVEENQKGLPPGSDTPA